MLLDVVVAGLLVLFAYLGWRHGAMGQALRVIAAIAVFAFAAPVSALVRRAMWPDEALVSPAVEIGAMILAALLLYIGVSILGWIIIKGVRRASDTLSILDTLGGTALGVLKGGILVYFLVSCVVLMEGVLARFDPDDRLHARDGQTMALVRQHNILAPWRFPDVARLHAALRVASHVPPAERAKTLKPYGDARKLIEGDAFASLLKDAGRVEAARHASYGETLLDADARAFLADEAQVKQLRAVDWSMVATALGVPEPERVAPAPAIKQAAAAPAKAPTKAPAPAPATK